MGKNRLIRSRKAVRAEGHKLASSNGGNQSLSANKPKLIESTHVQYVSAKFRLNRSQNERVRRISQTPFIVLDHTMCRKKPKQIATNADAKSGCQRDRWWLKKNNSFQNNCCQKPA